LKWQKQKKEERKQEKREEKKRTMKVKRLVEEWEIWDKKEEIARFKEEIRKLVLKRFHKWIKVFGKKQSERILIRKVWDHAIDLKK